MGFLEVVQAITAGEPVAFDRSTSRYAALDDRYSDGRAFVESRVGPGSGVLLDLANFVTAVTTYDRIFHLENDALAPEVINELLGEGVVVPLPPAWFDAGVRMEAGVLADTWQEALEHAGRLRRENRQAERGRAAEVWIPVLTPAA